MILAREAKAEAEVVAHTDIRFIDPTSAPKEEVFDPLQPERLMRNQNASVIPSYPLSVFAPIAPIPPGSLHITGSGSIVNPAVDRERPRIVGAAGRMANDENILEARWLVSHLRQRFQKHCERRVLRHAVIAGFRDAVRNVHEQDVASIAMPVKRSFPEDFVCCRHEP